MKSARRCIVSGRVQGVGFRYYVYEEAESAGVCGYVRNLVDGTVEVVVEGEENAVEELLARVKEGPRWSIVEEVRVENLEPTGRYSAFLITR